MKKLHGIFENTEVYLHTIKNDELEITVSEFGATLISLKCHGQETILSHPNLEGYFDNGEFYGCIVAPIANRTENAQFEIDNEVYHLEKNDGQNNLHTTFNNGSNKRIWSIREEKDCLICRSVFPHLQAGVPGNRKLEVIYQLDSNKLHIKYKTVSDRNTIFAPTNHAYFNLDGSETILDHTLTLNCSYTTEIREGLICTGKLNDVTNTPFDFRKGKKIGQDIRSDNQQIVFAKGYDHNFCIDNWDNTLRHFACLEAKNIKMDCFTTMPGVQVYTGNFLPIENHGVCLETQHWPNAINKKNFPSPIILANKEYTAETVYQLTYKD